MFSWCVADSFPRVSARVGRLSGVVRCVCVLCLFHPHNSSAGWLRRATRWRATRPDELTSDTTRYRQSHISLAAVIRGRIGGEHNGVCSKMFSWCVRWQVGEQQHRSVRLPDGNVVRASVKAGMLGTRSGCLTGGPPTQAAIDRVVATAHTLVGLTHTHTHAIW
jgi:hypothetical protein